MHVFFFFSFGGGGCVKQQQVFLEAGHEFVVHVRCFVLLTGSGTALFGFISALHGVAPTDGENERDRFWLFSVFDNSVCKSLVCVVRGV